ncbi:hypothetical protein ACET3Z_014320 [Daucus carota]
MAVVSHRLKAAASALPYHFLRRRPFGSAAALAYDYDEWEHEDGYTTMEDSEGCVTGRGVQWVILGDPMAKRHVYADRLSKLLDVPHISMGTLVRQELSPHSFLYKQIANSVNQGKLVPQEVIFGLLSKRLEEGYCRGESGFILDGIPRTRVQAEVLDKIADIDLVLNIKCTEDCMLKGLLGDQACSACHDFLGMHSSIMTRNLHSKVNTAELNGANLAGVGGDKLRTYAEQSKPIEEYYKKQKKLLDFQVAGPPGESWNSLLAALHLQHMSAFSSSQKLNA